MSEKVHYEDNLFYLLTDITRLRNGLKLSIDKDFFASKFMTDLLFVDDMLTRHYDLLKNNTFLIRRKDYLFSIQKLKKKLTELEEEVLERNTFFSEQDQDRFPDLKRRMARHLQDIQSIRKEIRSNMADPREDHSSLSSNEYSLLMDSSDE